MDADLLFYRKRFALILLLLFSTVGCDQVTKMFARTNLSGPLNFLGGFIRFQHSENPGAFLSFGEKLPPQWRFLIFTVGVAIILIFALWYLWKKTDWDHWTTLALTLIVAGGVGNLIDRALKGTVTDFVVIGWGWAKTGIFNIADMAILSGGLLLIAMSFKKNTINL